MHLSKTKIGLGLAALGRPEYINIRENTDIDKSLEAFQKNTYTVLDFAYNKGVRYFDTAPSYGKGELFLKQWHNRHSYNDVVFGTKWGYTYMANWELGYNGKHEIKEHSLEKLREQWMDSKPLLPQLKIYQVHSATLDSGILENKSVHEELHRLKNSFDLKIGITTSGANQKEIITEALKIKVNNQELFDCFQVTYNIFEQSTKSVLKTLKELGKTIIIKEAMANGRVFKAHLGAKHLDAIINRYNVGMDAIALRFVMDTIEPDFVLSGAANIKQLEQNLKALNFVLTESEIAALNDLKQDTKLYWEERNSMAWN